MAVLANRDQAVTAFTAVSSLTALASDCMNDAALEVAISKQGQLHQCIVNSWQIDTGFVCQLVLFDFLSWCFVPWTVTCEPEMGKQA